MSSNTQQRVLSALFLLSLVVIIIIIGQEASIAFVGFVGLLVLDEILVNFFKLVRSKKRYLTTILLFAVIYTYVNYVDPLPLYFKVAKNAGIILNILGILFLFLPKLKWWKGFNTILGAQVYLGTTLLIIPFLCMSFVLQQIDWVSLIILMMLTNFSVDIGAWFFGKNFGKHKLMPTVSPKKTVEGAVGGVICSAILSSIYWKLLISDLSPSLIILFFILACCAQIGDLIQSFVKRRYELKDSSSLIPGHGGVYDRVDSLIFVAPLFVQILEIYL